MVNFILRRDFEGAETTGTFGTDAKGGTHRTDANQTFGHNWGSGSALLTCDYFDQTPLSAAARSYTQAVQLPFFLVPEQLRKSALLNLTQTVSSNVDLFATGSYSHRSTESYSTNVITNFDKSTIGAYNAILGARIGVAPDTQLDVSANYSSGKTHDWVYTQGSSAAALDQTATSRVLSIEADLNGSVFSTSAGTTKFAIGTQYRREQLSQYDALALLSFKPSRNVGAAFAELHIPIISPASQADPKPRLEFTVADREEHYSDFGSTNNPKFGLAWRPVRDVKLRATYGSSFVAPLLSDLNPIPNGVIAFNTSELPGATPPGEQPINALVTYGGNAQLGPQTARTWTVGADFTPIALPGFNASINYYQVRFKNQITNLQSAGVVPFTALPLEAELGPQIIQRNPAAALIQQLLANPAFVNFGGDVTDIAAIINSQQLNLASTTTRGIDFSVGYSTAVDLGTLDVGLEGAHIFKFAEQFIANEPSINVLNTPYNPIDLKLRGHLGFNRGGLRASVFVNYVKSYTNNLSTPSTPVASWTTLDATAAYDLSNIKQTWLHGVTLIGSVQNIANREPPFVQNVTYSSYAINYDGANANPLGRSFQLLLRKRW